MDHKHENIVHIMRPLEIETPKQGDYPPDRTDAMGRVIYSWEGGGKEITVSVQVSKYIIIVVGREISLEWKPKSQGKPKGNKSSSST